MVCDALGSCGHTFSTYFDPEAADEEFQTEFLQLRNALRRADFINPLVLAVQNALGGSGISNLLSKVIFPVENVDPEPEFYGNWKKAAKNVVSYFKNGQADLDRVHGL